MRIVRITDIHAKILDASIVTIGNFDGVHLGHAEIFAHLRHKSLASGLPSAVVTFEPHPLKILAPESAPSLITTFEQKAALIEESGVDYLVVVPFTAEFARVTAHKFVIQFLCGSLGMRHIIIGHDYAFGRNREGDFNTLENLGVRHGFVLEDLPPIGEEKVIFSSSLVRTAVAEGDMETATQVLGRYYHVYGSVAHGSKTGSKIGFPTANLATENELIPPDGVYAVMVSVGEQLIMGACNIGKNPTLDGKKRTIETFLLDYSGQLYGESIAIYFVRRLRDEKKFGDLTELAEAISQDVLCAREILATAHPGKVKHVVKPVMNEI